MPCPQQACLLTYSQYKIIMDLTKPPGGNRTRGPGLVIMCWIQVGIAIAVVGLRIWGRVVVRGLGPDDYMMLLTLVLFVGFCTFLTYCESLGGFRHMYYLSPEARMQVVKYNWISQPWCIMGYVTGKIAVALLILRILGPRTFWRKWSMIVILTTNFTVSVLNCIFTYVQCSPTRALWTPELIKSGEANCWDPKIQSRFAIFLSSLNVTVDFFLAVLPVTIFWKLKMPLRRKLALCGLLGLGLLAAVFASIKTKYLSSLSERSDFTWDTYELLAWSVAELFVIIVCGSIPPIKPLWDRYLGTKKQEASKASVFTTRSTHTVTKNPSDEMLYNKNEIRVVRSWDVISTERMPAVLNDENERRPNMSWV